MKRKITFFLLVALVLTFSPSLTKVEANEGFSDLSPTNSHYESVMALVERDAISGYKDGTFRPSQSISRQHVAVILTRALDLPIPNDINSVLSVYNDVNNNDEYAEEIAAVTEAGFFKGSNNRFLPQNHITRQQMATVLNNSFDLNEYQVKQVPIRLSNVASSHRGAVQALADLGLTDQLNDFRPAENLSRAQFSTFLIRTIDFVESGDRPIHTYEQMVLNLVNEERAKEGLAALQLDSELNDFAQFRADDMVENDYFSHDSPIHGTFTQMVTDNGLIYRGVGENIAWGYNSPEAVVDGWMTSPGHKANILGNNFSYMGLVYKDSYWVQIFAGK